MRVLFAVLVSACIAWPAAAQTVGPAGTLGEVYTGGELENYLRVLQLAGVTSPYPWSIRGFSMDEVRRLAPRDSAHPWAERYSIGGASEGGVAFNLHAPATRVIYNSAFPFGGNDGPVWAGRGMTAALQGGASLRYGGLSLTLAPVAFWAQNAEFDVVPHELSDRNAFADARRPTQIDLPQRFGDGAYARIDPGESTLRADAGGAAAGISTANQYWGPATEYPLILGNNAPGFLHVFMGTSRPVNVGLGRLHGRVFWGRLEESRFATTAPDSSTRFGTGIVAVFSPRGVPGLEIGGSRFFHMAWPEDGIGTAHISKPLETFLKAGLYRVVDGDTAEPVESVRANQLASTFIRWAFPASGFEVYGELASEDHRHNLRDWLLEPDHGTAYALGFRKVWRAEERRLWVLRGETMSAEASHLARTRRQDPFYIHAHTRQGHTNRGQILGTPSAYGGAASTLAVDHYHPGGRATVSWKRGVRQEVGEYREGGEVESLDAMQSLGAEAVLFRGRWEIVGGGEWTYNANRNFESDVANLSATLGARLRL